MKALVFYFSQTGSTLRIAEAIYSGIKSAGVECDITPVSTGLDWRKTWLRDIDISRIAEYDLIGIGGIAAHFQVSANIPVLEENLPDLSGKHCFLFATHGMNRGETFATMADKLRPKGVTIIAVRSWYGSVYMNLTPKPYYPDGHPDDIDFREAADWGREVVDISRRVSNGETGLLPQIPKVRGLIDPVEMPPLTRDKAKCAYPRCTLCMDYCPMGVIDYSVEPEVFQAEGCIKCHLCEKICPTAAIDGDFELMAKSYKENLFEGAFNDAQKGIAKGYFRPLVNFDEVKKADFWYKLTGRPRLRAESSPCVQACPIHMDIPNYLYLTAEGKFDQAYQVLRKTNPLPSVCGRVCHHPCEDNCKRRYVDESLSIDAVKRLITEQMDNVKAPQVSKNGSKVAIAGSGPCGLAAAHDLALSGYDVTVFEALPVAGGMLAVGIPEYRLPRAVLKKEIDYLKALGVKIKTNMRLGDGFKLGDLAKQGYAATLIAIGAHKSQKLDIPGEELEGVEHGISLLRKVNTGEQVKIGQKVAVIGGGNVAVDAAQSALRLGAKEVTIVYRRSREEMPAIKEGIEEAEAEGIKFLFLANPVKILDQKGKVKSLECVRMKLGKVDESGRKKPVPVTGSEFTIDVDMVIPAIGQEPDTAFLDGIDKTGKGTIKVDKFTLKTSAEGIFAGSEVVTGAGSVIRAIADGKRAARSIDNYIKKIPLEMYQTDYINHIVGSRAHQVTDKEIHLLRKQEEVKNRARMKELNPEERVGSFAEVKSGLDLTQGQQEARRCLRCCWAP